MAPLNYKVLTEEQVSHFLEHGYVLIPEAFTREQATDLTSTLWSRLGYSPTDKSTWLNDRVNMPFHNRYPLQTFSPKAWNAICDLLGGEERVDPASASWSDGWIVNLGSEQWDEAANRGEDVNNGKNLDGWHVDGDFFVHFLDSREQALLVIPMFSDVGYDGGATMICPEGIGKLAKWLYDHPQGVMPRMRPADSDPEENKELFDSLNWYNNVIQSCSDFRQMTGKTGDVVLMHPFMLHSASRNLKRTHRFIINPPVSLKEPFNFSRSDPSEYSLVELKTLKELGMPDGLGDWKITGERRQVIPERLKVQAQMKEMEERRLRGENVEANNSSGVLDRDKYITAPLADALMV